MRPFLRGLGGYDDCDKKLYRFMAKYLNLCKKGAIIYPVYLRTNAKK